LDGEQPVAALEQFLAASQVTIAWKSVINGQSVIDLRLSNVPGGHSADYLVNAQTFQVVKFVFTVTGAGKPTSYTTYYHWLPRTKSLVAQVNTPQIPAGYRQVGASK
jgi:hypothetical protein